MDLAIEANRNSALFNTMQQVLDVYNPLMHKARPTVVNQTKHRIRVQPTRWGNTLDSWNGRRTARFDMPRIGSLVDASLKVAFKIPGTEPSAAERALYGNRGKAKTTLTRGTITGNANNTSTNNARGRLDRIYADRLLGFNMIQTYTISSKSRVIFSGTGEYLLIRFSQLDSDQKEAVFRSITPVDVMETSTEDMFYAPAVTYQMAIPLFMFFNEHITNALDVNFSEEVHIDITFKSPSELFYYGNLGDLNFVPLLKASGEVGYFQTEEGGQLGIDSGSHAWDQSTTAGARTHAQTSVTRRQANTTTGAAATGSAVFGTASVGQNSSDADTFVATVDTFESAALTLAAQRHIQGVGAPWDSPGAISAGTNGWVGGVTYYGSAGYVVSGPTFSYPDVDSLGESVQIQFEMNADYIIQDTDAYRALRAQMFPEGTGLTEIVYDLAQETFSNLFASSVSSSNLLDIKSGGTFVDPSANATGITIGDSTRFVDLQLRVNNLCFATHFMVRKHSDMTGDSNTNGSVTTPTYGKGVAAASKLLGAHKIHSRLLPVHYFQLLAAGRVIYESDGDSHLNLTQSAMYSGTGKEWGTAGQDLGAQANVAHDTTRTNGRPFNVYSINFGLQASRLENTGCLSYQNLNNPTLRIYFKPEAWNEHQVEQNGTSSEAIVAATLGVQVDVVHEFFNVVTINSGNGEITSGLNQ